MTSSERRQAILEALCRRRHDKIDNLAYEFQVSERTIRNDVLMLSLSYPVYTVSGRYHSGVYIADDYYLGKQYLTEEQLELLLSLKSQVGDDQRKILDGIVKKFGKVKKEDRC